MPASQLPSNDAGTDGTHFRLCGDLRYRLYQASYRGKAEDRLSAEDVGFYDDMTGPENLIYTARLNGISDAEAKVRALELMEHVGLAGQMKKKTGKYSRGMRQRLGLADVLIKNPEIIILDEPTSGIDPAGVQEFIELIRQLSRKEGLTVLFSSHHLDQVQKFATAWDCSTAGSWSP